MSAAHPWIACSLMIGALLVPDGPGAVASGTRTHLADQTTGEAPGESAQNPFLGDQDAIQSGKWKYRGRCRQCHSVGIAPNLFKSRPEYRQFMEIALNGVQGTSMPAWKDILSREDLWKIHAYIVWKGQQD